MLNIHPVHAFRDNYIWVIHNRRSAAVVDPGDAQPVIAYLQHNHLQLNAILITHHHSDHTGGILELLHYCEAPVYGPATGSTAAITHSLRETDRVRLEALSLDLAVLEIPGHTLDHIAYYGGDPFDMVFCGDTLFACGCGRVFEGTPEQMYQSLQKLARLPDDTLIFCAHEYTLGNIMFARTVDPDNTRLTAFAAAAQQLRLQQLPTVPTKLELERAINPFLRCAVPAIAAQAQRQAGYPLNHPEAVFSMLRDWKNRF
ncbi:MAG: hydroxyacylglutathione hydrolase [Nitrosomonas sp.]|nr:MAG: hydroxyacylglutathione hydrolase [Nitrosomonas sp.]